MRIRLNLQDEIASNNNKQTDCINATIKIICSKKVGYFLALEFTPCLSRRFQLSCCRHARRFLLSCFPAFLLSGVANRSTYTHTPHRKCTHTYRTHPHTQNACTQTHRKHANTHTHTHTNTEPHPTHRTTQNTYTHRPTTTDQCPTTTDHHTATLPGLAAFSAAFSAESLTF